MQIASPRAVTPSRTSTAERRRHQRKVLVRPCKVYRRITGRYTAGRSCDASDGGILIEVESSRPFAVGERIGVGVAWAGERQTMMREDELVEGAVVRVAEIGPDRQRVAIEFAS